MIQLFLLPSSVSFQDLGAVRLRLFSWEAIKKINIFNYSFYKTIISTCQSMFHHQHMRSLIKYTHNAFVHFQSCLNSTAPVPRKSMSSKETVPRWNAKSQALSTILSPLTLGLTAMDRSIPCKMLMTMVGNEEIGFCLRKKLDFLQLYQEIQFNAVAEPLMSYTHPSIFIPFLSSIPVLSYFNLPSFICISFSLIWLLMKLKVCGNNPRLLRKGV